jgi:cytoskeleton protein RodZ
MSEDIRESESPAQAPSHIEPLRAGAGARLTAARRQLGLSIGDIARQLKLSVRQVEALERDDYASFAGPVFVRGFLRNYARLLNLDPDALIAAATPAPPVLPPETTVAVEDKEDAGPSERSRRAWMGAVIGLLVVIAVILLASNAAHDRHVESAAHDASAPAAPPPPLAQREQPPSLSAPAESSRAPSVAAQTAPMPTPGLAPPPVPTEGAPAAAAATAAAAEPKPRVLMSGSGPAQVHLTFEGESWVEVHDASGATIFSRLNAAGTQRIVRGTPPLSLVVGNASAVKLRYHDRPVDLQPHTNTNADVARITLE